MARVETIVVGGGIGAGSPFDLNHIPYIASVDPPLLVSSPNAVQVTTGNIGFVVSTTGADPDATATEVLRVKGGFLSLGAGANSFIGGKGAAAGGARSIAIGQNANAGTGAGCVLIGANTIKTAGQGQTTQVGDGSSTVGGSGIAIGASSLIEGGGSSGSIVIGNAAVLTTFVGAGGPGYGIVIGHASQITTPSGSAGGSIILGNASSILRADNCTLIGDAATADPASTSGVGIGFSVDLTAAAIAIGASALGAHDGAIAIGIASATYAANTCTIGGTTAQGQINQLLIGRGNLHTAAVNVLVRATNGSGADVSAGNITVQAGLGTGAGTPGVIIFTTGSALGSGSVLQTAATRMTIAPALITLGAGVSLLVQTDNGYTASNQTSGAAANVGTLTNAPAVGNPTFWLRVVINGTNFAIPAWPV